jgi:hypothetical protein
MSATQVLRILRGGDPKREKLLTVERLVLDESLGDRLDDHDQDGQSYPAENKIIFRRTLGPNYPASLFRRAVLH